MRVLIADDHELILDTLVAYIEASGGIEVVTAPDFPSAQAKIEQDSGFDLVLLDLNMPGMNGISGLQTAISMDGVARVALFSGDATRETAEQALAAGAAGFVPKTLPAKSLVNAIRFMAMGEQYLPADFLSGNSPHSEHPLAKELTQREQQVLKGLTEGKANKEIARDLELSEPTVKLHIKTLYRKIGASNRTQAAIFAKETGLF